MFTEDSFDQALTKFQVDLRSFGLEVALSQPKILRIQGHWQLIHWRFEVLLHSGCIFDGIDLHEIRRRVHVRNLKYRLCSPDGALLFMVDSHGEYVDYANCPHLHTGPPSNMRLQEGMWELNGLCLQGFTINHMWNLVRDYEEEGVLPWRTR